MQTMRFQSKRKQIANNRDVLTQSAKGFRKRRKTKLVRLSKEWHEQVKEMKFEKYITISKRLDHICKLFFKQNPELKVRVKE